jgi:hypothetical protein
MFLVIVQLTQPAVLAGLNWKLQKQMRVLGYVRASFRLFFDFGHLST